MTPKKMTLEGWQRTHREVETGDTGRTIYTDEPIHYSIFELAGEFYYVEHDELHRSNPKKEDLEGTPVHRTLQLMWTDDEGRGLQVVQMEVASDSD